MFVDVDQDPRVERPFLEYFDFVVQRVESVIFHALRSRLQQTFAAHTHSVI